MIMVHNEGKNSNYNPAGWLGSLARSMSEGVLAVVKSRRKDDEVELAQIESVSVAQNTASIFQSVTSGTEAAAQRVAPSASIASYPCSTSQRMSGADTDSHRPVASSSRHQATSPLHSSYERQEPGSPSQCQRTQSNQETSTAAGPTSPPSNSSSTIPHRLLTQMHSGAPADVAGESSSTGDPGHHAGHFDGGKGGQMSSAAAKTAFNPTSKQGQKLPPSGCPQLDRYLQYLLGEAHPHSFMYYPGWGMPDTACAAVGEFLRHDKRIKVMTLANNLVKDGGCELIAEGLAVNTTLMSLDLSKNKISDMGALALAEALHSNTTLKELQLNGNLIGEEGAEALAAAVATNSTLKKLNLTGNPISAAQKQVVEQALRTRIYRMPNKHAKSVKAKRLWPRPRQHGAKPSSQSDIELTDSEEVMKASARHKLPPSQAIAALAAPASTLEASLADQVLHLISELKAAGQSCQQGVKGPDSIVTSSAAVAATLQSVQSSTQLLMLLGLKLAWRGYEVVIRTSSGGAGDHVADGSVCGPQHTFLRVVQPGPDAVLEPGIIIDPFFRDQFLTQHFTERYQNLLAALPPVLVMAESRLYHLVEAISNEMMQDGQETGSNFLLWGDVQTRLSRWLCKQPTDMLVDPHTSLDSLQLMFADYTGKQQGLLAVIERAVDPEHI